MDYKEIKEKFNNILQKKEEFKDYKIEYIIYYKDTDNYEAIAINGVRQFGV